MKLFKSIIKNISRKSLPANYNYLAGGMMRSYMVMPGQPVWMERDYFQFAQEAYAKNVIAYRSISMIASAAASIPFLLYQNNRAGRRELISHPALKLLKRPNPMQSCNEFMQSLFHFRMISGNAYIQSVAPSNMPPAELYLLRPDRVQIIAGKNATPLAYRYTVDDKYTDFRVDPLNGRSVILHLKNFHPTNDWYGLSPIEAAAYSIDQHNQASQWNQSLMQNGARPSGALVVRGENGGASRLSEDQYNRMKLQIDEQFSGAANAGRPLLLEGGLEWKEMSLSPKDMDFIASKHASSRDIALAFGVPPQLLGIPGDNTYSNFQEARLALWEQTVLPLVNNIVDSLNNWLLPMFGENLEFAANTDDILPLALSNQAIWDRVERASFLTDNEKRAAVGYKELEEEVEEEEESEESEAESEAENIIFPPFMPEAESFKYSPDQPRVPSGDSEGGQWTSSGGGGGSGSGGASDNTSTSDSASSRQSKPKLSEVSTAESRSERISKPKKLSLNDAITHLQENARPVSLEKCATFVRQALNKGGFDVRKSGDAKNYGKEMLRVGFKPIVAWSHQFDASKLPTSGYLRGYTPKAGDVAVIQPYPGGNSAGHMTMYDGKKWISDFNQRGIWAGPGYRKHKPNYVIYRYSN